MPGTPKREWKRPNPCRSRLYIDVTECVWDFVFMCVCVCVCVCTFADDRRVGCAHYHYMLEVFYFFSSIFLSLNLSLHRRPTPTSPLIIARKSEFIHTRTIAYITCTHTRAYEKVLGKKINPPPLLAIIPFPSWWCCRSSTMGTPSGTLRQKKKKIPSVPYEGRVESAAAPDRCAGTRFFFFFSPPLLCILFLLFTQTTIVGITYKHHNIMVSVVQALVYNGYCI